MYVCLGFQSGIYLSVFLTDRILSVITLTRERRRLKPSDLALALQCVGGPSPDFLVSRVVINTLIIEMIVNWRGSKPGCLQVRPKRYKLI
jgi:hypothetical protein